MPRRLRYAFLLLLALNIGVSLYLCSRIVNLQPSDYTTQILFGQIGTLVAMGAYFTKRLTSVQVHPLFRYDRRSIRKVNGVLSVVFLVIFLITAVLSFYFLRGASHCEMTPGGEYIIRGPMGTQNTTKEEYIFFNSRWVLGVQSILICFMLFFSTALVVGRKFQIVRNLIEIP